MPVVKYCPACQRNVGLKTTSNQGQGCLIAVGLLILGLIIPLWPITLPLCWLGALLAAVLPMFLSSKVCAICGTPEYKMLPFKED